MAWCSSPQADEVEPHNYEAIIKHSESSFDTSSKSKIYEQLNAGVFLDEGKQKYWVDKKRKNKNCFKIFAKGLEIAHGRNTQFWYFHEEKTSDWSTNVVAELRKVWWLEVKGKFNVAWLTPGVKYEVAFVIKLKKFCHGWDIPVNLRLRLPNGQERSRKEKLATKKDEKWHRIPVGKFKVTPENRSGEIEFVLEETKKGVEKTGLFIEGIIIEPKPCCVDIARERICQCNRVSKKEAVSH